MFAKSIKKNGHFRVGVRIPPEGVNLGEVTAEQLALLQADASIVLSDVPFEPVAVDAAAALSPSPLPPAGEGQDEAKAEAEAQAKAEAEAQAKAEAEAQAKAEAEAQAKATAAKNSGNKK